MKSGLIIGKFYPLHSGHIDMICKSSNMVEELHVLVCTNSTQTWGNLTVKDRCVAVVHEMERLGISNVFVHHMDDSTMPDSEHSDLDVSKVWSEYLIERFPSTDIFIGSEEYIKMMADFSSKEYYIFDRSNISGTQCRNETLKFFQYISPYLQSKLTKRICVVGAESSGKSTLTRNIHEHFDFAEQGVDYTNPITVIPEAGRMFMYSTELGVDDFETFALNQYSSTFLNLQNTRTPLQIVDTDLGITKLYISEYLDGVSEIPLVDILRSKEKYDHYIVLDPSVQFVDDGLRIHDDQKKREIFFDKVLDYVMKSGVPYTVINDSTYDARTSKALNVIEKILKSI